MTKPREIRSMYPHHIYNRGAMKTKVFLEPIDYNVFLKQLTNASSRYGCTVLGYCLMPNHYHLILQPLEKENLSQTMQLCLSKYSQYLHKKYSWPGHVFQSRFQSKLISDIKYLNQVVEYIRRNPTEAQLADSNGDYRWLKIYDKRIQNQKRILAMGTNLA